ncbi:hypothetical protein K2173_005199 [Erythroxylum novogranatense]|uniref:Protein CPR-5 n=1 Tax=Erythroxylum novogranatense TaxID=1862640 RepID=A0AAV8TRN0_9ROSI|nr:hypothetical protein K2173_005199 [Erythroxylum novogranatense]
MNINGDLDATANGGSNPTVHNRPSEPKVIIRKKKKKILKDAAAAASASTASSSSSSCAFSSTSRSKGGGGFKLRNLRLVFAPTRRRTGNAIRDGYMDAVALPLGMSFAAVIAQVLERKDGVYENMSVDHLSRICTSAVKESLANVFVDDFDFFARNFKKSFGSTLRTLRLINEWGANKRESGLNQLNVGNSAPNANKRVDYASSSDGEGCSSRAGLSNIPNEDKRHLPEEEEESICTNSLNQEVALHRQAMVAHASSSICGLSSQLTTMDKYVMEQARSNDLKAWENCIAMENLRLKKEELALHYDSNDIGRSKLAVDISKASFKVEKFKNQLEDSKHDELLKKCIDFLAAGLIIMLFAFSYATYVYSYKRITEATISCNSIHEELNSWWIPRQVSTFNSWWNTLWCQAQVWSRIISSILMILTIVYFLSMRTATSQRIMPVTLILLLLAVICGYTGKLCVDMLGGNGFKWLIYWEAFCLIHFLSIAKTSVLFHILYGPVSVSEGTIKQDARCPYWFRRILFDSTMLLLLPVCCGLLPFTDLGEWKMLLQIFFTGESS